MAIDYLVRTRYVRRIAKGETMTNWDQYYADLCLQFAAKSKDPSTKVGACIVGPDMELRGSGYNGFPRGIADTPERLNGRELKNKIVVHAEMNSILAAARVGIPIKGCTMYLWAFDAKTHVTWGGPPCTRCAVEMIQAGIVEVRVPKPDGIPERWKDSLNFARDLLLEAGVRYVEL